MCSSVHFPVCFTKFIRNYKITIVNLRHQILGNARSCCSFDLPFALCSSIQYNVGTFACIVDIPISELNFHKINLQIPAVCV
jgi:hypothetical protein